MSQTDNDNLGAKLDLRRWFLDKYSEDINVLECCQGAGVMWSILKKEYPVRSHWGIDLKPKKGRLKLDSVRVLLQPGWPQNVIDVDTYGSPWKHWFAILETCDHPVTVFLTIGQRVTGTVGRLSNECFSALGIPFKIPVGFHPKLGKYAVTHCLARGWGYGTMVDVMEIDSGNRNVRYIGARFIPTKKAPEIAPRKPSHKPV